MGVIVTGHQPNCLPGVSVLRKIAVADHVIWMDRMQFVRHGWVNRNRLADGTPLIVPFDHRDRYAEIRHVRIGDDARWQTKLARTLAMRIGPLADPYIDIIGRPYRLLVGLNLALLRQLTTDLLIDTEWTMQSHLAAGAGNPMPAFTADHADALDASTRIAEMTAEIGGTVYLSGAGGRGYIDEEAFRARGIEHRYVDHDGPNPSAIELLREATPIHRETAEAIVALLADRARDASTA